MAGRRAVQHGEGEMKGGVVLSRETRTVIMQELFDEIYMGENHAPAAISFKLQFVKSIAKNEAN